MVIIDLGGFVAKVEGGVWHSDSKPLQSYLRARFRGNDIPGSAPDPDRFLAEQVINTLGGAIVKADKVEYNKNTVY